MSKNYLSTAFPILFLFFTASCEKEAPEKKVDPVQEALVESQKICPSPTEHHFSGLVLGEGKCMNHQYSEGAAPDSRYIAYIGYGRKYEPDRTYLELGMDTSPSEVGDEHIKVLTPNVNIEDPEAVDQLLAVGRKAFSNAVESESEVNKGFVVEFSIISSMGEAPYHLPELTTYSTKYGEQEGSILEVISKTRSLSQFNSSEHHYEHTFLINCKLYDEAGVYKGSIENGIFSIWVKINEPE